MRSTEQQRVLPHSLEAEQSVLGGLMLENDRWDEIAPILTADSFYSRPHQKIFAAMRPCRRCLAVICPSISSPYHKSLSVLAV